jgi:aryl-alcohol dehydrogenase-like predicted oxidoreductase
VWLHLCWSPEDVEWSLNDSLRMLGTDYVDCFLIHWPIAAEKTEDNQAKIGADGKVSQTTLAPRFVKSRRTDTYSPSVLLASKLT